MLLIITVFSLVFSFVFAFARKPLSYRLSRIGLTFVLSELVTLLLYFLLSIGTLGVRYGIDSMAVVFANFVIAFFTSIFAWISSRRLWSVRTAYFMVILLIVLAVFKAIVNPHIRSLSFAIGIFASSCLLLAGLFLRKQWARYGASAVVMFFGIVCIVGVTKTLIQQLSHGKFERFALPAHFAFASLIIFLIICGVSLLKSSEIAGAFSSSSVSNAKDKA